MAVLQHPRFKKIWFGIKLIIRVIVFTPLSLLVILALLLGTPFGARVSIALANQFVPDLALEYRAGTLNNHLQLQHAHWSMSGIEVRLSDLELKWQPQCLIQKQLCVDVLNASAVNVDININELPVNSNSTEDNVTEPTEINLPFGIQLQQTTLQNVKVRVNDMHFNAAQLAASAKWQTEGIIIDSLLSENLEVLLGQADLQEKVTTNKDQIPDSDDWPLASLPAIFMPIPIQADNVYLHQSRLNIQGRDDLFQEIHLTGSFKQYQLQLDKLAVQHSYGIAILDGQMEFLEHYPLNLNLHTELTQVTEIPSLSQQAITAQISQDWRQLKFDIEAQGNLTAYVNGNINLQLPELPYELILRDTQLNWPLTNPIYKINELALSSQGNLISQAATVSGTVMTPYHPDMQITSKLNHTAQQLSIDSLISSSDVGNIKLSGSLDYHDGLTWNANVTTEMLALQTLTLSEDLTLPETLINGSFETQGQWKENTWDLTIANSDLTGQILAYPFNIHGSMSLNHKMHVSANNLDANVLGAQLQLNGSADEQWNLIGSLTVPDFSLWLTDAYGQLQANVNVNGNEKNPLATLNAKANNLVYQGLKLTTADFKGTYQPFEQHKFNVSVVGQHLVAKTIDIDEIQLNATGNERNQNMTIQSAGEVTLQTTIDNEYLSSKQTIETRVQSFSVDSIVGTIHTDTPFTINWLTNISQGEISPFCLQHVDSQLCLIGVSQFGQKGHFDLSFKGNVGKLIDPFTPSNLNWDGNAELSSVLSWKPTQKPTAKLALNFEPGHIVLTRNNENSLNIGYQFLKLTADLSPKVLHSTLNFESSNLASLNSELNINVTPDRNIQGFANIKNVNLQPLGEFFPQLDTLEGKLSSFLDISGTLETPNVSGKLQVSSAAVSATANPTKLENINLLLTLAGQKGDISGDWTMGKGKAEIAGEIAWPQGQFSGNIHLLGSKLGFIQPPLAIIDISPDLHIIFDRTKLDVQGKVVVPSGNIKIVQLAEGGVAVSSDVVFNDSISATEEKTSPYAITTNMTIDVGNELFIDGMGLTGKLQGALSLQQQAFTPPLLYGDIKVVQGSYKFMGQTLTINKGIVQFAGPTEVPNLNIEAIRVIKDEDITAGVRVTGTPKRPVVTLFSNPTKEQGEILSYIIKGTGFSSATSENNALMMGAAIGLSSQIGGGAISNIGSTTSNIIEKFGFSNVQLDANDEGRVAISGFIGENLMMKYGIGVFNPGYEMTVRYYILSQLYLESVSGTLGQSLDIYYNFDL